MKEEIYPLDCPLQEARDQVICIFAYKCTFSGPPQTSWISDSSSLCADKPSRYSNACSSLRTRSVAEDYAFMCVCEALVLQRLQGVVIQLLASTQPKFSEERVVYSAEQAKIFIGD